MAGPLSGLRIIEFGGIGPGPFAGMLLADHGAEVIRIERPGGSMFDSMKRSRKLVELDLKSEEGRASVKRLLKSADGAIEGYRPGTLEKLGLSPEEAIRDNPKLVFGRMTGWGQTGPYSQDAGHDLNYISMAGALHCVGPKARPMPPLIFAGDMGGGGMYLAFSMASALVHAARTGEGQIIDCAMVDGAGLLMTPFYELQGMGVWVNERESNLLDGAAYFYRAYETKDGKFMSVGPLEPQFYTLFLAKLGLADDPEFQQQMNKALWPKLGARLEEIFRTKTRDEWSAIFENTDACVAPVLTMAEAPSHKLAKERGSFVDVGGVTQPAPGPRYSKTPLDKPFVAKKVGVGEL